MSEVEAKLRKDFPEATQAECRRFSNACKGSNKTEDAVMEEAERMLENYLDWRSCYGLDYKKPDDSSANEANENDNDAEDWGYAIRKAIEVEESIQRAKKIEEELKKAKAIERVAEDAPKVNYDYDLSDSQKDKSQSEGGESKEAEKSDDEKTAETQTTEERDSKAYLETRLRQMVCIPKDENGAPITDKNGHKIIHVLSAMIDRVLGGASIYTLALSLYLDRKFDRDSDEKYTVMIDFRSGDGWPNPNAFMMIQFVRTVTAHLQDHYPERLERLLLYPCPSVFMRLWWACKSVLSAETTAKVTMFPGPAVRTAPIPEDLLLEYVDPGVLKTIEKIRDDSINSKVDEDS